MDSGNRRYRGQETGQEDRTAGDSDGQGDGDREHGDRDSRTGAGA